MILFMQSTLYKVISAMVFVTVLGVFAAMFATNSALASGVFTIKGTIKSFDEKSYTVATEKLVYEIDRAGFTPAVLASLKTKKTGDPVELTVSTDHVLKAETKKK